MAGVELLGLGWGGGSTLGENTKEYSKVVIQMVIFYLKLTNLLNRQQVSLVEIPLFLCYIGVCNELT